MKRVEMKLRARQLIAENAVTARLAVTADIILRLGALSLTAFFIYCIFLLPDFLKAEPYGVPSPFYYALFILCLVIISGCCALRCFFIHRWFYLKAAGMIDVPLKILPVRLQLKIIYLHFLILSRNLSVALFYLMPFAGTVLFIRLKLTNGLDKRLFYMLTVLSLVFLLLGLYYLLASRQKTAFLDTDLLLSPDLSARECFENACKCGRGECFAVARLKLSFIPWLCLCVFIFPILFVAPYCLTTLALYKKTDLEKQGL